MAKFQPTFGEDLERINVIVVDSAHNDDVNLLKGSQIEFHIRGDIPLNVAISDGNHIWSATTMFPTNGPEILEFLCPYTGVFHVISKEVTSKMLVGTARDTQSTGEVNV